MEVNGNSDRVWWRSLKEKYHFQFIGLCGRLTLNWLLKKWEVDRVYLARNINKWRFFSVNDNYAL
jgi:hypothetical protein